MLTTINGEITRPRAHNYLVPGRHSGSAPFISGR
jgi:hypothetical protein